ncbi:MAG: hypothetical protein QXN59_01695 [Candidatus Micrarchaeaceae archaeon]
MYEAVAIAIAVAEVAAASSIFIMKDIMHSALALAAVFLANSAAFLILGQPILAIMQMFIMVGGVATYLFVGVASEHPKEKRHTNIPLFVIISVLTFVAIGYPALGYYSNSSNSALSFSAISAEFASGYQILYVLVTLLFGVALGAILLLKNNGGNRDLI